MLVGIAITLATIAAVFLAYFGARFVLGTDPDERSKDIAASVLFRISALHGLVLALVFASEVVEYHQLEFESAVEVNAVTDVYFDAGRYGPATEGIREALRAYLSVIPTEEWRNLGETGTLSSAAWASWDKAYLAILDLEPASARQASLRENMLAKIHVIAENRDLREHHAKSTLSYLFWTAALVGVLLISVGYYTFPPKRENLMLLSLFAGYTGFILFTIFAMSNPYSAPAALEPTLFIDLLNDIKS